MWGDPDAGSDDLLLVNGHHRTVRGTFAQWGVPLPHPERVIDTVLAHSRNPRYFTRAPQNACNVLDVAHPLWLTRTGYRGAEVRALAQLTDALSGWMPGAGFGFAAPGSAAGSEPSLQGTEMWLAIVWYLADTLGVADALGYRPGGIHRPELAQTQQSKEHAL